MLIIWHKCIYVDESLDWQFPYIQSLLGIMMDIMAQTYNMFSNLVTCGL